MIVRIVCMCVSEREGKRERGNDCMYCLRVCGRGVKKREKVRWREGGREGGLVIEGSILSVLAQTSVTAQWLLLC